MQPSDRGLSNRCRNRHVSSVGAGTVIPAEAVEAAHRAWREQAALDGSIFEYNLRAALEAAAPYMTGRSAWHDAVSDAYVDGALSADQANVMWARNPYKQ